MAHGVRIRAVGDWRSLAVPLPAELEAIDSVQEQAVDGDTGGTWNQAAQIVIGGAGLEIWGRATLSSVNVLAMTGTAVPSLEPRSITRVQEGKAYTRGTVWVFASVRGLIWEQSSLSTRTLRIPLHLPRGSTLTSVTARVLGAGGHTNDANGNIAIETLPVLQVVRLDNDLTTHTPGLTVLATAQDTSANAAAYQAAHDITATLVHEASPDTERLIAELTGEAGTGAIVGLRYYQTKVTFTSTMLDEVGG